MKNLLLILCTILGINMVTIGQTKPSTTTKKTTTTTKKTTTTAKPPVKKTTSTTTTAKKPTTTNAKTVAPQTTQPAAVVQPEPAPQVPVSQGPPQTGPVSGPKSYDETTTKPAEKTSTKTTKTTSLAKTEKPTKDTKAPKAKSSVGKQSYFGLRGGYNLATVDKIEELVGLFGGEKEYQPGYMGGLFVNIALSKAISIQPEVLYSQQGFRFKNGDDYLAAKLTNVNVPLLLKVAVGAPALKFFINAGPYIGYKIQQNGETNIGGIKTNEKVDFITEYDNEGVKDNMFDFGAMGGAGFQIGLGRAAITIEGRYQYGMADPQLYKNGKPAEIGTMGHQRVITGTIGLLFPIGGK